jgi:hypothetical protein
MQQKREPGFPFHQGADRAAASRAQDVGSDRGAVPEIALGPSPRPALRTGRAAFTASGAPRTATVTQEPGFLRCWSKVWGCCSPATGIG